MNITTTAVQPEHSFYTGALLVRQVALNASGEVWVVTKGSAYLGAITKVRALGSSHKPLCTVTKLDGTRGRTFDSLLTAAKELEVLA